MIEARFDVNRELPRDSFILSALVAWVIALAPAGECGAREPASATPSAAAAVKAIRLMFKRDPRAVEPTRGIGLWADGPPYAGSYAQQAVEVRAEGVDAVGKPAKISPEWISSDPNMVTVSPSQGDDVTITVHRAGESRVKISYPGFSKELTVKAKSVANFLAFEITDSTPPQATAAAAKAAPPPGRTKKDVSYAAGMNLAKALRRQSVDVDVDSLVRGVKDTLAGGKTRMTEEEEVAALNGLETDQRMVQASLSRQALGEKNKREGEAFLAENKTKEGVVSLPSGLQYKVIKAGEGKRPTADDVVSVGYRASFTDGQEFDNSYKRAASESFPVKATVKGLAEALQLMPVGSQWQLFVPPELAYGEHGAAGGGGRKKGPAHRIIGPNATLIFELELFGIEPAGGKSSPSTARAANHMPAPEMLEALKKALQAQEQKETKQPKP